MSITFVDIIASIVMLFGLFWLVVAAIGFVRMPGLFCRFHVTGIMDTLGAPIVMLGVSVYLFADQDYLSAGKLILGIFFLFFTSPLVGHFLSRAALESGYAAKQVKDLGVVYDESGKVKKDELEEESK